MNFRLLNLRCCTFAASCFGLVLSFFSASVWSLGLGELRHSTYLGEQLEGEIALVGSSDIRPANIRIRQLNDVDARRLGVELVYSPYRLDFELITENGEVTGVRFLSRQPVAEPFVNLLIQLEWPTGSVYREYALLLDAPAVLADTSPATTSSAADVAPATSSSSSASRPSSSSASSVQPSSVSSKSSLETGSRYTVRSGDTLSGIVSRMELPEGVGESEAVDAVFVSNPSAFQKGNINMLLAGANLQLPSGEVLQSGALTRVPASAASTEPEAFESDSREASTVVAPSAAASSEGRLTLSQGANFAESGADYTVPQIREQIDSTQEMIDLLVRENEELRERIERIESSEYLTTLTQLVEMQRQQIDELHEEIRSQAGPSTDLGQDVEQAGTSVSNPLPSVTPVSSDVQPTFSQKLAANFWLFIASIIVGLCLVAVVGVLVYRFVILGARSDRDEQGVADDIKPIDDAIDSDFALPVEAPANETQASNVTNIHSAVESRRSKTLSERVDEKLDRDKKLRDDEVKERIRQKTEQYKHTQTSAQAPARINEVEIDVLVGLDEEINELLSMAKIYCTAGKYSEARAILTAQQKIESDPRLVDALQQIDEMEKNKEED